MHTKDMSRFLLINLLFTSRRHGHFSYSDPEADWSGSHHLLLQPSNPINTRPRRANATDHIVSNAY